MELKNAREQQQDIQQKQMNNNNNNGNNNNNNNNDKLNNKNVNIKEPYLNDDEIIIGDGKFSVDN